MPECSFCQPVNEQGALSGVDAIHRPRVARPSLAKWMHALALLCALLLVTPFQQAHALIGGTGKVVVSVITKITKNPSALPDKEIVRFSRLAGEPRGTAKLGEELGRMNLSRDVLEDVFLRIAIHQEKLPRAEAQRMFHNLTGVPGFSTTMRKVVGNSEVGTAGHLFELRLANEAVERGFKVRAIGEKFVDGLKRGPTDIDLVLQRGQRVVAIEAKHYGPQTRIPLDQYRADLDTLVAYRDAERGNVMTVFTFVSKPVDEAYLRMLKHEANRRGVELVFGDSSSSITQIRQLVDMK